MILHQPSENVQKQPNFYLSIGSYRTKMWNLRLNCSLIFSEVLVSMEKLVPDFQKVAQIGS